MKPALEQVNREFNKLQLLLDGRDAFGERDRRNLSEGSETAALDDGSSKAKHSVEA